jgi:hypothetical protein
MPAKVILTVTQGALKGQRFLFDERTTCLLGRDPDCAPRVPNDAAHRAISRHHCFLDINPPLIRVRDFGSRNATFVNGTKIGQRRKDQRPEDVDHTAFPEVDLHDGDELRLDQLVFQVQIVVARCCASCGVELTEAEAQAHATNGDVWCRACRTHQEHGVPQRCASCGTALPAAASAQRTAAALCADCRADVGRLLQHLLAQARTGEAPLRAIAGYTLLKELGRGGMGAVYLARHDQSGEQVALKVMLPQIAADQRAIAQFLRETELTGALHHPHVVTQQDAGCAEGLFFFTLEYCDGGSLKERLTQHGGCLPIGEACGFILQALDGLHYAHTTMLEVPGADGTLHRVQGLVHRDLKPANLLLSGIGGTSVVKVSDFGLAKAFEQAGLSGLSRTGEVKGTVPFMPRQLVINFKYAQPEVDVWALAASLYQLLTGASPHDFPRGREPWLVILQEEVVPIRKRNASIPKRLAEVIDHAVQDRPEIGFKTALAFKQALESVL